MPAYNLRSDAEIKEYANRTRSVDNTNNITTNTYWTRDKHDDGEAPAEGIYRLLLVAYNGDAEPEDRHQYNLIGLTCGTRWSEPFNAATFNRKVGVSWFPYTQMTPIKIGLCDHAANSTERVFDINDDVTVIFRADGSVHRQNTSDASMPADQFRDMLSQVPVKHTNVGEYDFRVDEDTLRFRVGCQTFTYAEMEHMRVEYNAWHTQHGRSQLCVSGYSN